MCPLITFGFQKIPLQIWKTFSKNHYYHSALCLNPAININLALQKCLLISNLSIEWSCRLWLMLQYCFPSQHAQSSSENYDICALMLGIGSLLVWMGVIRYIGFFKTFNVSSSQIVVCKNSLKNQKQRLSLPAILHGAATEKSVLVAVTWLIERLWLSAELIKDNTSDLINLNVHV